MESFPENNPKNPTDSFERKENERLTPIEIEPRAREELLEMGFSEAHIEKMKELMYDLDYDDCKGKVQRFVKEGIVFDSEKRSVIVKKFHDVSENKGQCATLSLLLLDKLSADPEIYKYVSEFNEKGKNIESEDLKNKLNSAYKEHSDLIKSPYSEEAYDEGLEKFNLVRDKIERLESSLKSLDKKSISISKCYGHAPTHFVETSYKGESSGGMHVWLEIGYYEYDNSKGEHISKQVVLDPSFRKIDVPDKYDKTTSSGNPTNISFRSSELFEYKPMEANSTTIGVSSDNKIAYNLRFGFDKDKKPFPVIDALDSRGNLVSFSSSLKYETDIRNPEITENHIQEIKEILAELDPKNYIEVSIDDISRERDITFNGFSQ